MNQKGRPVVRGGAGRKTGPEPAPDPPAGWAYGVEVLGRAGWRPVGGRRSAADALAAAEDYRTHGCVPARAVDGAGRPLPWMPGQEAVRLAGRMLAAAGPVELADTAAAAELLTLGGLVGDGRLAAGVPEVLRAVVAAAREGESCSRT